MRNLLDGFNNDIVGHSVCQTLGVECDRKYRDRIVRTNNGERGHAQLGGPGRDGDRWQQSWLT